MSKIICWTLAHAWKYNEIQQVTRASSVLMYAERFVWSVLKCVFKHSFSNWVTSSTNRSCDSVRTLCDSVTLCGAITRWTLRPIVTKFCVWVGVHKKKKYSKIPFPKLNTLSVISADKKYICVWTAPRPLSAGRIAVVRVARFPSMIVRRRYFWVCITELISIWWSSTSGPSHFERAHVTVVRER